MNLTFVSVSVPFVAIELTPVAAVGVALIDVALS